MSGLATKHALTAGENKKYLMLVDQSRKQKL